MKKAFLILFLLGICLLSSLSTAIKAPDKSIGINVVLNMNITDAIMADLSNYGKVLNRINEINAVTLRAKASVLNTIRSLPYVAGANPDAERQGIPIDTVAMDNFSDGLSTWNLDAINVTDTEFNIRTVSFDGAGVYVAVLDTGLVDLWRQYFPQERIVSEHAISFGGGGGDRGHVSTQPNKWEHDTNSHGTHVTSTILGYQLGGTPINGVAPMANIIPVKVLNQAGWGWSSVIAQGIMYVADLKENSLSNAPVVINMSLSGPVLDVIEQAAIDYAISNGVIIVAAAGNQGSSGMEYPGAYEPVISTAAASWSGEWTQPDWWLNLDVNDPTDPSEFNITDFSGRQLAGQDLDVAAPGSWVVGPYQLQMGKTSYYYLGGTSMACPHVAGTVALMLQKNAGLSAAQAEDIIELSAIDLGLGSAVQGSGLLDAAAALANTP